MKKMHNSKGFTFIELMLVISIIGILAAIAIPSFSAYRERAYRSEAYELISDVKKNISEFYDYCGVFPKNNEEAGIAPADLIKGKYVSCIEVVKGAIHVRFDSEKCSNMELEEMVIYPAILKDNPTGPVVWFWDRELNDMPEEFTLTEDPI